MDRLSVRGGVGRPSMATSASRLSPVPGTANGLSFPTVLEEPSAYMENGFSPSHHLHV